MHSNHTIPSGQDQNKQLTRGSTLTSDNQAIQNGQMTKYIKPHVQSNFGEVFDRSQIDQGVLRYTLDEQIKNSIIDVLREVYSKNPDYRYIPSPSGSPDLDRTSLVITDVYTYDAKYLPCLLVSMAGGHDFPIGFNQGLGEIIHMDSNDQGGYANRPLYHRWVGAWESTVNILVAAEDTLSREELISYTSHILMHIRRMSLLDEGVFIKKVSFSGESEEPFANDLIYVQNISAEIFSEWVAQIPVGDSVENLKINLNVVKNNEIVSVNKLSGEV